MGGKKIDKITKNYFESYISFFEIVFTFAIFNIPQSLTSKSVCLDKLFLTLQLWLKKQLKNYLIDLAIFPIVLFQLYIQKCFLILN